MPKVVISELSVTAPVILREDKITPLETSKLPPDDVRDPVPSAFVPPTISEDPEAIVVPPLYVLLPVKVTTPEPVKATAPVPDIVFAKVNGVESLKLIDPLFVIAEVGVNTLKLVVSYTTVLPVGIITVPTLLSVGIAPPVQLLAFDQLPPDRPSYVTEAS